jgi:hypothetical protein
MNPSGQLHRVDGPAKQVFSSRGVCTLEEWYRNGILHREGGPARLMFSSFDGQCLSAEYLVNGGFHRIDGPALIKYDSGGNVIERKWYLNSKHVEVRRMNPTRWKRILEMDLLRTIHEQ